MNKYRYIFGNRSIRDGYYTPPGFYWSLLIPKVETGWCGSKGAYFRYNNRFFEFFWKPYSSGYYDEEKIWHNSKKFQFLTFEINNFRTFSPNKGKNMNVTRNEITTVDNAVVGETPFTVDANYYIDAEGNRVEIPFDTDSDGEATRPVTAFIAEDAADHAVTVH